VVDGDQLEATIADQDEETPFVVRMQAINQDEPGKKFLQQQISPNSAVVSSAFLIFIFAGSNPTCITKLFQFLVVSLVHNSDRHYPLFNVKIALLLLNYLVQPM
jgi:hypothetical protein